MKNLFRKLKDRFKHKPETDVQTISPLNTLAPKILSDPKDLERVQPYLNSLKQAIDEDGVNNIAITGSYGSGKSTLIKTFQHLNPVYKYLNISLASFKDNKEGNQEEDDKFERKLEVSILQQIFYHVEPAVIPDSRFKRIINITDKELRILTGFLILWIFSTLILFQFGYIEKLNPRGWEYSLPIAWIAVISSIIFFSGVALFIKNIYRLFSNSKISKLNIKGELELGESVDKSVFNQHLEEILYFFERTEFNVVIIEDVDRFNSTDIFTKLREINILINNSNLIKRPVKFVYAIKDGMFTDKNDRVKFFEFIIPIIPFINPSNANDQLTKLIRSAQLEGILSPDFTSDVITFIDDIDMRLLINIFQEYQLYRMILNSEINQDNLFSIIIYKNMYPDDFAELPKRKGKLYNFFSSKNLYIKDITEQYYTQIKNINDQITLLENEVTKPIKELRIIYLVQLANCFANFHSFYINHKNISLAEAAEDEFFNIIKAASNIQYARYESQYYDLRISNAQNSGMKFSEIEKEVSTKLTYSQREKLLKDKTNNQIDFFKVQRESIKTIISETEAMSIKELFEKVDANKHLGVFKDNYLMRNLLLNGYIDEHYDDYISLFHEVNLTKEDFAFERKIKSGHNLEFEYSITKVDNLIKRLPDKYFRKEQILNFSLFEFMLENESKYKVKLENFYKALSIDGKRQFDFIQYFIDRKSKKTNSLVKAICKHKPTLWQYIHSKSGLPKDKIKELLKYIFEYADKDSIFKFNDIKSLEIAIAEIDNFFEFSSSLIQVNTIQAFILERKILIEYLDIPSGSQKQIFEFIYNKNSYQINQQNILTVIKGNEKDIEEQSLNSSYHSTILRLDLKQLINYINTNFESYIKNILLAIEENVNEEETIIIDILNNANISQHLKQQLIIKQNTKISSISSIYEIEMMQLVIANDKLEISWECILDYYDAKDEDDFDNVLITFLDKRINYDVLANKKLSNTIGRDEEYIKKISGKIVNSKELKLDAYISLLSALPYTYNRINYDQLSQTKVESLINKKILNLTKDNFDGLKLKNNSLHIKLIEVYQSKFEEKLSELTLDSNDWYLIYKSSTVTLSNKLSILQKMDDTIIINDSKVANAVCEILPVDKYISLRFEVLDTMFKSHTSLAKRLDLLNLHFDKLDDSQVQSLTEKLGDSYSKIFIKQHKPVFSNNSQNLKLFTNLKEREMIHRFEPIEDKNEIRVIAKY